MDESTDDVPVELETVLKEKGKWQRLAEASERIRKDAVRECSRLRARLEEREAAYRRLQVRLWALQMKQAVPPEAEKETEQFYAHPVKRLQAAYAVDLENADTCNSSRPSVVRVACLGHGEDLSRMIRKSSNSELQVVAEKITSRMTTHICVGDEGDWRAALGIDIDEPRLTPKGVALLTHIMGGRWVVPLRWLETSLEKGTWQPEAAYGWRVVTPNPLLRGVPFRFELSFLQEDVRHNTALADGVRRLLQRCGARDATLGGEMKGDKLRWAIVSSRWYVEKAMGLNVDEEKNRAVRNLEGWSLADWRLLLLIMLRQWHSAAVLSWESALWDEVEKQRGRKRARDCDNDAEDIEAKEKETKRTSLEHQSTTTSQSPPASTPPRLQQHEAPTRDFETSSKGSSFESPNYHSNHVTLCISSTEPPATLADLAAPTSCTTSPNKEMQSSASSKDAAAALPPSFDADDGRPSKEEGAKERKREVQNDEEHRQEEEEENVDGEGKEGKVERKIHYDMKKTARQVENEEEAAVVVAPRQEDQQSSASGLSLCEDDDHFTTIDEETQQQTHADAESQVPTVESLESQAAAQSQTTDSQTTDSLPPTASQLLSSFFCE